MGQRGPAPLPGNVHMLRGNPSKKPLGELLGELRVPSALPSMPENVASSPLARAEWERVGVELLALGLVSEIDRAALMAYCIAYADFVRSDQMIRRLNQQDWAGVAGDLTTTPSGYQQMSVWRQINGRAAEELKKWMREFGMTPSARSGVTPADPQMGLPGIEKPAGWASI
jgi:phage terminase small subunit